MKTVWIVPIEPIDQRYTKQWYENIPADLTARGITCKTIEGVSATNDTTSGAFLNFAFTNAYKASQVENIANLFSTGAIKANDKFLVTGFSEKSVEKGSCWISAGLCHLHVDLFKDWDGQPFSLERVCLSALARCGALKAVALQTDFIDIGIPDDYFRFCHWIAAGRKNKLCS